MSEPRFEKEPQGVLRLPALFARKLKVSGNSSAFSRHLGVLKALERAPLASPRDRRSSRPRRSVALQFPDTLRKLVVALTAVLLVAVGFAWSFRPAVSAQPAAASRYTVDATQLAKLQERLSRFDRPLPAAKLLGCERVVAYEEHPLFAYVVGRSGPPPADSRPARFERRVWLLKPSLLVVADVVAAASPTWTVVAAGSSTRVEGGRFRVRGGRLSLSGSILLPTSPRRISARSRGQSVGGHVQYRTEVELSGGPKGSPSWLLLVLRLSDSADAPELPVARLDETDTAYRVEATEGRRRFTLVLPKSGREPGTIAVASADDGKALLDERPLAAGVLPHGQNGVRQLERWDSAYAPGRTPPWDTGRPDSHLKEAVESGVLKPCRVVELGCGTGTNAVYLASKGFDVTALDLAPRALVLARQKAERAGVRVRWLLANVLAPPEGLGQFDLIFDRGCYHGVRRVDAAGYVRTVRQLSHPGTLVFILAGNANEKRQYGPPRVSEDELRADFAKDFRFRWLKTVRFDGRTRDNAGPLGWCVLLERKGRSEEPTSSAPGDGP